MKNTIRLSIPFIAACLMLGMLFYLVGVSDRATAAPSPSTPEGTMLVTTLEDELNTDGDCSLREAITAANDNTAVDACPAGDPVITDTITFDVVGTITVTSQLSVTAGAPLEIFGADAITLNGGGYSRLFYISPGVDLTLNDLTIMNGYGDYGGGIHNGGTLEIKDCTLSRNTAGLGGGSIFNASTGALTIINSTVSDSYAEYGGGIDNWDGTLVISNSIISGNTVLITGGGIYNRYESAVLKITNSTLTDNDGDVSGSIDNFSGTVVITHSTISESEGWDGPGGIWNHGGRVEITDSTFSRNDNHHTNGGAISNLGGWFTISNSTMSGNVAQNGGLISNGTDYESGTMIIIESTISRNWSVYSGGAIQNISGTLIISGTSLSDNYAVSGGGIHNGGTLTVTNSTLSGNSAENGGGIYNESPGMLAVTYSTLSRNTANVGGGINNPAGGAAVSNTIIANSVAGGECSGMITDGGHNISSDATCSFAPANGSLPNTNPILGPLQDNGGHTWTHALLPGSPAIDAGDDAQCPPTDQRGVTRPLDGNGDGVAVCDIGSFEVVPVVAYLPVVIKSISGPLALASASSLMGGGVLVALVVCGVVGRWKRRG